MGAAQGKAEGDTPPSVEPLSYEEYAALQECFIHMLGGGAAALPGVDDTALLAPLSGVEACLGIPSRPTFAAALMRRFRELGQAPPQSAPATAGLDFRSFRVGVARGCRGSVSARCEDLVLVATAAAAGVDAQSRSGGEPVVTHRTVLAALELCAALLQDSGAAPQPDAAAGFDVSHVAVDALCFGRDAEERPAVIADLATASLPLPRFREWATTRLPALLAVLPAFLESRLLAPSPAARERAARWHAAAATAAARDTGRRHRSAPSGTPTPPTPTPTPAPSRPLFPHGELDAPSSMLRPGDTFALMLSSKLAHCSWTRLYASQEQGLSFNRLQHHVLGYSGPTVVLLRTTADQVMGALCAVPWQEAYTYFGSCDCSLFSLRPHFAVYRPSAASYARTNYMYLNSTSDTKPHGVGWGGEIDAQRLWLDEDFERCRARHLDLTYEVGPLLWNEAGGLASEDGSFSLHSIEVWGLGGSDAVRAQAHARKQRQQLIERMRKVDRGAFLQSDFDKEMFFDKTFSGTKEGGPDQQQR